MTRKEVLEFLELPDSATDNEIRIRMDDKLTYFQRLSENAPNDFLRKLHTSNTEKIKNLQTQLLTPDVLNNELKKQPSSNNQQQYSNQQSASSNLSSQQNKTAIAWLVRHTENQSAKTFPIYYGKNFVGRADQSGTPTVVINEDPYVSRVHALLEVIQVNPLQIRVYDDPSTNGGKASKNGTYINGDDRRLTKNMIVKENDTIQIGMTKLRVRTNNTSVQKIVQEVEESDYMKTVVIDIF